MVFFLKKNKTLFSLAGVSYLPQSPHWSFSWAGVLSTFQLQFSCCCWRINWFEMESFSSVRFSSDLFLDLNIYAGSSMKRPWVFSPAALTCLHRPLVLSQIIGRLVSISLSERGREGPVRAYRGWEWNICDLFSSRWMVWIRSDVAVGWACGPQLEKGSSSLTRVSLPLTPTHLMKLLAPNGRNWLLRKRLSALGLPPYPCILASFTGLSLASLRSFPVKTVPSFWLTVITSTF